MVYPAAGGRPSGGNAGVYAKGLNKCREYLYRLPVNPKPGQKLSRAQYLDYAERVQKARREGQPRTMVFHRCLRAERASAQSVAGQSIDPRLVAFPLQEAAAFGRARTRDTME